MTKDEMMEVIFKIAENHKNKDFGYFTKEDIKQEVWVIALNALSKYQFERGTQKDEKKAFEHWMNRVVANRLKTLYRDKYIVPQQLHKRSPNNLINLISIEGAQDRAQKIDLTALIENKELWTFLIDRLDDLDQEVLESLLSGENIGSYYKMKLHDKIEVLLDEFRNR